MRKVNNYEIISLLMFINITMYLGININIIKTTTGVNAWLTVLISNIIGFIPLILFLYIANYKPELKLNEKINFLYKKTGFIINIFINIVLFIIGATILYNICNFITSQLLYRTPQIIIIIILMILVIYNTIKGINVIIKVSTILIAFNILLFLTSVFSLIPHLNLDNFLPILKDNLNILPSAIKLVSINVLPLLILLIIPKDKSSNKQKYTKNIIFGYIISGTIAFTIVSFTYGILGKYLVNAFGYPEYIVLKKISILNFAERIENIISNQWIVGGYIYLVIIMYYISNTSILSKKINNKYIIILLSIILIIATNLFFENNTHFYNYINKTFIYVTSSLIIFYILIIGKIFINKKKSP